MCGLRTIFFLQLSDLILDTPEAPTVIGNFMARSEFPQLSLYSVVIIMLLKP